MLARTHAVYALQLAVGLPLIYLAVFLREDEEGILQNRAEEWWLRITYRHYTAQEKLSSFFREVSGLTARIFDRLFGKKLISFRVLGSSILLTPASCFLFGIIFTFFHLHTQEQNLIGFVRSFLYFFLWAMVPAVSDRKMVLTAWWLSIVLAPFSLLGFVVFLFKRQGGVYVEHGFIFLSIAFALSLTCDVLYLALTRWMLSQLSKGQNFLRVLYLIVTHVLLLTLLLAAPLFIGLRIAPHSLHVGVAFMCAFAFNALNLVISSMGFLIAIFLFANHLIWPLLERPLYAFQRFSPIKQYRKQMFAIGCGMILIPLPTVVEMAKFVVTKF